MAKINKTISSAKVLLHNLKSNSCTNITFKIQVKELIEQAQQGHLECQPGRTLLESFEHKVNKVLNTARDTAGSSAQNSLKETNNVKAMVTAGSKGSFINISQVTYSLNE